MHELECDICEHRVTCGTGAPGDVYRCACPTPPESYRVVRTS